MILRWFPYALLCSIFLASADFFVKLASNKMVRPRLPLV